MAYQGRGYQPRGAYQGGYQQHQGGYQQRGPPGHQGQMPSAGAARAQNWYFLKDERSLLEVVQRYPNLVPSPDFVSLKASWPVADFELPPQRHIPFAVDAKATLQSPAAATPPKAGQGRHFARVMLPSAPKEEEGARSHPHMVKFLVAKRANGGVMAPGGEWAAVDGKDPTKDATLHKTAVRHCKQQCGVDLKSVKQWVKFMEITYKRECGAIDRTVFYMPDFEFKGESMTISRCIKKEEKEVAKTVEEETEIDVEKDGVKSKQIVKVKKQVTEKIMVDEVVHRSIAVSLEGLLEYNLQDSSEETAEVSMFAELLREHLSHQNTVPLLEILKVKAAERKVQATDAKRKREAEAEELRTASENKRQKLEAETAKKAAEDAADALLTEEEQQTRRAEREVVENAAKAMAEAEDAEKKAKEQNKKSAEATPVPKPGFKFVKETKVEIDKAIVTPFAHFDSCTKPTGSVQLKLIDNVLHSLGHLSKREVNELIYGVQTGSALLNYRALASTVTTVTKEVEKTPEPEPVPVPVPTEEPKAAE